MHYIIIGIVAICIIVFFVKHILFNPRVNSVICIIGFIVLIVLVWNTQYRAASIVFAIAIIDCIRDISLAEELYETPDIEIDKVYAAKSILGILTLGLARAIYLLIIVSHSYFKASSDVNRILKSGCPFRSTSNSNEENYNYFYKKRVDKLIEEGKVVSSYNTFEDELSKSYKRLNKLYPKKFFAKLIDKVAGNEEMKKKRNDASNHYEKDRAPYVCINTEIFNKFPQAITEAMSKRSTCSPMDIKDFDELKSVYLDKKYGGKTTWVVYFIIMALQPLVESGEFTDEMLNDNDVLDNHAYQYIKSKVQMKSTDADSNPLFALDDD